VTVFACTIRTDASPVPRDFRRRIENAPFCRGRSLHWHHRPGFIGVVSSDPGNSAGRFASLGTTTAVGAVRLDNRDELRRLVGCRDVRVSDLELILRALADSSTDLEACVARILGDFAFVAWDAATGDVIAARDAFGVKKLYHAAPEPGVLAFSSRAELLVSSDAYDTAYLAARLAERPVDPERTAYVGVLAVPGATILRLVNDRLRASTFWSPYEVARNELSARSDGDYIEAFRTLLIESVRLRLDDAQHTWSHLSGGLDSSSVVSIAEWLTQRGMISHGLAGTVSFIDPLRTGADEKEYSDAVVDRYRVRNEAISHNVSWRDVVRDPPHFDQPNRSFPFGTRDRRAASIIRSSGGHVLLTGIGGDHLVLNTMFFFADWIARGAVLPALRDMLHRAAVGRVSFWELAFKNAVLPLLPGPVRRAVLPDTEGGAVTPWVRTGTLGRRRSGAPQIDQFYGGRLRHKYADAMAATIAALPPAMPDRFAEDLLELRHPYLYRPLVELALRLPPEICVRPHARKWILREAMRGILPESVRTRVGKGSGQGLVCRSLLHDRLLVDRLLHDPILEQLGCVDGARLREAVTAVESDHRATSWLSVRAHIALDVELWLQLRAGRWAADDSQSGSTSFGNP
jgi:asparagine synthase (glutamine-hydrolysing)